MWVCLELKKFKIWTLFIKLIEWKILYLRKYKIWPQSTIIVNTFQFYLIAKKKTKTKKKPMLNTKFFKYVGIFCLATKYNWNNNICLHNFFSQPSFYSLDVFSLVLRLFFLNNTELKIFGRHRESNPVAERLCSYTSGPGFDSRWRPKQSGDDCPIVSNMRIKRLKCSVID